MIISLDKHIVNIFASNALTSSYSFNIGSKWGTLAAASYLFDTYRVQTLTCCGMYMLWKKSLTANQYECVLINNDIQKYYMKTAGDVIARATYFNAQSAMFSHSGTKIATRNHNCTLRHILELFVWSTPITEPLANNVVVLSIPLDDHVYNVVNTFQFSPDDDAKYVVVCLQTNMHIYDSNSGAHLMCMSTLLSYNPTCCCYFVAQVAFVNQQMLILCIARAAIYTTCNTICVITVQPCSWTLTKVATYNDVTFESINNNSIVTKQQVCFSPCCQFIWIFNSNNTVQCISTQNDVPSFTTIQQLPAHEYQFLQFNCNHCVDDTIETNTETKTETKTNFAWILHNHSLTLHKWFWNCKHDSLATTTDNTTIEMFGSTVATATIDTTATATHSYSTFQRNQFICSCNGMQHNDINNILW